MQTIEFTNEELELMREVFQRRDDEIGVEILRTDSFDFKDKLKQRREVLEKILGKIGGMKQSA